MMMPKKSKKLAGFAGRSSGTAYTGEPRAVKSLDNTSDGVMNVAFSRFGIAKNPQSLVSEDGVIPLPDEDELDRVRRKRAARRAGGRASTILSDDNRLGG